MGSSSRRKPPPPPAAAPQQQRPGPGGGGGSHLARTAAARRAVNKVVYEDASYCTESSFRSYSTYSSTPESGKIAVEYRPCEEIVDVRWEEELHGLIQVCGDKNSKVSCSPWKEEYSRISP
ncbi:nucleosome-remodeling factor subunit BPTF-like isoform X2 [Symphalangus syndactylus]|uniref:nucleosome-remodeling factor subunit BPTF-like isoform X2 n=1 Tax=Symphalangus syndactylus TaxID=9590 RepID=UPI002441381A|nr:nucleosome-remodeling factor subunit BPTF-like isoform X2 [Symphalangus syndactylus]